ncbi:hypothetical protein [Sansalvadorimonas verongulae]|uniref:hypothetical protein n=1 Tax=Sansalvadorimonas verongulae TaxID=2172824 RepID=UPI0012BBD1B6|nr:hypothetical protein [Sansalvadorimonas verongulae]MTI12325.1 hypothetical protein [Sansalvadorimonas verongulae]
MIPHDALHWVYQIADHQCVDSYPRETLEVSFREPSKSIEALKQARLMTEFEDRSCVWIDFEKYPVITNPKTGQLCTFVDEDEGVIDVEAEQLLHYALKDKLLPLHLANMLPLTASVPPIEHIPGILWEIGQVKTSYGSMPVWYVRRLVSRYKEIRDVLASRAEGTSGLLFSGVSTPHIYQNLPGIRRVLVIGESLDPWSGHLQIDPRLLDNIFQAAPSEFADLPFEMPADKSYIRDNTTGEIYELKNNQSDLFYYLLVKLKEGVARVRLKELLGKAGYSTSYTSLKTPLHKKEKLLNILDLKDGFVELVPGGKEKMKR